MTTSQDLHDRIVGQNIPKRFLANLERNGDVEVLNWKTSSGEWATKTLREVADDAARLTTSLKDLGVGKGDTVVMMIRNRPEFHAIDLAVLFCGATPVSIYNSSAPDQIQYLVNDCGAKLADPRRRGVPAALRVGPRQDPDDRTHRTDRSRRCR